MHKLFAGYGGTSLVLGETGALLLMQSSSRSPSKSHRLATGGYALTRSGLAHLDLESARNIALP